MEGGYLKLTRMQTAIENSGVQEKCASHFSAYFVSRA